MDMGKERKGSKIKSRNGTGVGPEMRGRARDWMPKKGTENSELRGIARGCGVARGCAGLRGVARRKVKSPGLCTGNGISKQWKCAEGAVMIGGHKK